MPGPPVFDLLNLYAADHLRRLKSSGQREAQLRRFFEGRETLMTQTEIVARLDKWPGPVRNRYKVAVCHFFRWCRQRGHTDIDPEIDRVPEKLRDVVLSMDQLRRLWDCADHRGWWAGACKMLLLTGQRRGEVVSMDDVQGDQHDTTNGTDHIVHLVGPAPALAARRWEWVGKTTFTDMKKRWFSDAGVCTRAYTLYDIRRSLATYLVEDGQNPTVVDRILNHCGGATGVARVYNRAALLPQRKDVMERWWEMLGGV